jgi:hypothetical protein
LALVGANGNRVATVWNSPKHRINKELSAWIVGMVAHLQQDMVHRQIMRNTLKPACLPDRFCRPIFGEGGAMYILFGPAMAALVVIAAIQLRDHFAPSR